MVWKNVVQNMAEDGLYLAGYSYVNSRIHEKLQKYFPDEVDKDGRAIPNILLEMTEGGVSLLFTSAMMEVIRREEKIIDWLFIAGEAVISVIYLRNKSFFDGFMNKIRSLKGVKASKKAKNFNSQNSDKDFITEVQNQMSIIMQGRNSSHDVANTISANNSTIDTAIKRESHDHDFAKNRNEQFMKSTLLKTVTGTFTPADKVILQKVLGRENFDGVNLNIDELNKIHEFIFVTDSSGKTIGLSKAIVSILNAFGQLK